MDLLLDENNDLVFINGQTPVTSYPVQVVAQRLSIRLRTFLGEWFLNTTYGVPYWQRILGKKTTKAAIDKIFQQQILEEVGVMQITSFNSTFENRQYSLSFRVKVVSGEVSQPITISGVDL